MPLPAGDLATLRAVVSRKDRPQVGLWDAEATLRLAESMTGGELGGPSHKELPE